MTVVALAPQATASGGSADSPARAAGKRIGKVQFQTKPVLLENGYSLTVSGFEDVVSVSLYKGDFATQNERYEWVFANQAADWVTVREPDMTVVKVNASMKSDASVGASGFFRMKTNKKVASDPKVLDFCAGVKWQVRRDLFNGEFRFDTGTDLFGVIEKTSLGIQYLRRTVGASRCSDPPPCSAFVSLVFSLPQSLGRGYGYVSRSEGITSLFVTIDQNFENGIYRKSLYEEAPTSSFTFASDLSSAMAEGVGGFQGTMQFKAHEPATSLDFGCGPFEDRRGEITGDMVFNFDVDSQAFDPIVEGSPLYGSLREDN